MQKNYRQMFEQALMNSQQQQDPAYQQLESQIMKQSAGPNNTGTLGLVDHFTGTNLAQMAPKQESQKEKLSQLLQLRGQQQSQKLDGLGKLAQMQDASEARAQEMAFKKQMMAQQGVLARMKQQAKGQPKIGSEDKKALGYLQSLQRDLGAYKNSVKGGFAGGIRPEMWTSVAGDTPTTALRKALVENYGRLQSGGAISGDEEARFGSLFGTMTDSPEIVAQKLARIEQEINDKSNLYGGGSIPSARAPSTGSFDMDLTGFDLDSMSDDELMELARMRQ